VKGGPGKAGTIGIPATVMGNPCYQMVGFGDCGGYVTSLKGRVHLCSS